jgi:hypothetical protein
MNPEDTVPPPAPEPLPDDTGYTPEAMVAAMQSMDVSDQRMLRARERALVHNVWAHDLANRMELRRFQVAEAFDAPYGAVQPFPNGGNTKTSVNVEQPQQTPAATATEIGDVVANALKAAAPAAVKATPFGPYAIAGAAAIAAATSLWNSFTDDKPVPAPAPVVQPVDPLNMKLDWWYDTDANGNIPPSQHGLQPFNGSAPLPPQ